MKDISILIPARNEKYLQQTIDDIERHIEADTEILVGDDTEPIGQRAMTNKLAQKAQGRYLMKVDAHCSFGKGFDRIMLEDIDDRTILAPLLLGLDAERWQPLQKPVSSAYYFDRDFVFQYHKEAENTEPFNETMCLQGSAWMVSRENYWNWNVCDESYGSWGWQGVELGIQAWLNDGRCATTKRTYYAHLFRKDFPYERDDKQIAWAHNEIKRRFEGKVDGLVSKFRFPGDWAIDK